MHIKSLTVKNFKSLKDVTIHFNNDINILTGVNNSGKTTILEAIALWHECFLKLLSNAKSNEKNYDKGNWILGPSWNKYFPFDQINSIRSPFFEDIFHQRDKRNKITISAILEKENGKTLEVPFSIGSSGNNYVIQLINYGSFPHREFNVFFEKLPNSLSIVYASPVAAILSQEPFTTDPIIRDLIIQRESVRVIRNRIYKLLTGPDSRTSDEFVNDLNYILYNSEKQLEIVNRCDIRRDTNVLVNFKLDKNDIEKDIALLGSGTLQTIEILLNLYQPGEPTRELNLILLDEPDSHIHRDVQARLISVLKRFGQNKQIFISTHNESLIRNADYQHVFHLSGKSEDIIRAIANQKVEEIQPRFKGIYPSQINPVMRSIGSATGLDFINAVECDRLVFVEGQDDAKYFSLLLGHQIGNRKKYMFWVLGGISEVFENFPAYKAVFSTIKNNKTLWEKACLIFDKDFLSEQHKQEVIVAFKNKLNIQAYSSTAYTFEATVFTDIEKLAQLIVKWLSIHSKTGDKTTAHKELEKEYNDFKTILEARFNDTYYEQECYRYKNIREKSRSLFDRQIIRENDVQLTTLVRQNATEAFTHNLLYKVMTKDDVEFIINKVVSKHTLNFSVETDFIDLIKLVDKSTWFDEWNFVNAL